MKTHLLLPRKTLIMMPAVAVVGAALGAAIARDSPVPASTAIIWTAIALCVSSWAAAVLESVLIIAARIDPDSSGAMLAVIVSDVVLGGATGVFLSRVASADVLVAAGAASAILFLETLLIDRVLLGNVLGNAFVRLLQGSGGTRPEYSRAMSLAIRGDMAGARALLEKEIAAKPREVNGYRALAHLLRTHAHDHAGAAQVLERGLEHARPDAKTREAMTREIAELHMHYLDAPGRAAVILARYIDRERSNGDIAWARAMLKNAKSML